MNEPNRKNPPAIRPIEKLTIAKTRTITLDNGMALHILDRGEEEVNRLVALRAGGMAEAPESAVASLTSELLREGTAKASGASMAETMEYNGAWIRSVAHSHHITLEMSSLNSRFEYVVPIMADMWDSPSFPAQPFEVKREAAARHMELMEQKVSFIATQRANILSMGASHPLARTASPEEIMSVTAGQLRDFYDTVKANNPTSLYLSGRITPAIEDLVNRSFGQLHYPAPESGSLLIEPLRPVNSPFFEKVPMEESLQTAVNVTIPAIPRNHPDYIDLRIAVIALGGYFGSRLMSNIREEKGYTYGIGASLIGYLDGGMVRIESQCDNLYTFPLIFEIEKELAGMATRRATPVEIIRLKQTLTTALLSIIATPFSSMDYYINRELVGAPADYFERQLKAINDITPERIMAVSKKYLRPEKMITVIAGV